MTLAGRSGCTWVIVASLWQGGCATVEDSTLANERDPTVDAASAADAGNDGVALADAVASSDGSTSDGHECASVTFDLAETQALLTVPANVTHMHVKAWGAGGNDEGQCTPRDGGIGGYSEATFETSPGTPLVVIVGQRGRAGMTGEELFKLGFGQWGGGGLSGVFIGADPVTKTGMDRALIVAGGGGGASAPGCHPATPGNHPTAGGMADMQGGSGTDDVNSGGGGCIGGQGGAHLEGGKGGTGCVASSALDSRILHVEPQSEWPPQIDDPDYDGSAGTAEKNGRVVIRFSCGVPVIQ